MKPPAFLILAFIIALILALTLAAKKNRSGSVHSPFATNSITP